MKKLMRKSVSIALLLCIVLIVGAGCARNSDEPKEVNAKTEAESSQNETKKTNDTIEVFGTVEASEKKDVTFEFPVKVKDIVIVEGQKVAKGESLVELDLFGQYEKYENIENRVGVLEEQIIKQKSIIDNLTNEIQKKESGLYNRSLPEIKSKQLSYDIAKNAYEEAKLDLVESEKMFQSEALSQNDFDKMEQEVYTLEKKVLMEKSYLDLAIASIENQLEDLKTELIKNEKTLTDIEQIQLVDKKIEYNNLGNQLINNMNLKDSFIINGFKEGLIEAVHCEEGQVIEKGSPIVSLVDKSSIYIKGEVPEEFVGMVREGATVNVIPVSDKVKSYKGVVDKISEIATNKNNEVVVIIDIKLYNIDDSLKLNYNVNIEIEK